MARHRDRLPQLEGTLLVTDGGLETTLVFHHGLELPGFAAYPLLEDERGRELLRAYYDAYAAIARAHGTGLLLEAPTWRANPDWTERLGHGRDVTAVNRRAIAFLDELRERYAADVDPIVISGALGPRGDAYAPETRMSAGEAEAYHRAQVSALAAAGADMVTAMTLTYAEEAVGVIGAARAEGLPVAISLTVETDGRLPSSEPLGAAIDRVDAETDGGPDYYMVNCAHPDHFAHILEPGSRWVDRILGLRANASRLSHAELDESEELDDGDPAELGALHGGLRRVLRNVTVLGGCCGTDHRHVGAICAAWAAAG